MCVVVAKLAPLTLALLLITLLTASDRCAVALTAGLGNGVNVQPSYYNSGKVSLGLSQLKALAPNVKTVRIEVEPFIPISLAKQWISEAAKNGFSIIVTYHKATVLGSNDANELQQAANWWKTNYKTLAQSGKFVLNLMNEWGDHTITSSAYATAVNNALKIVRQVYSGTVIIDAPGWGQEAQTVKNAILGIGGAKIADTKIIPSLHLYPGGYNQQKNRWVDKSDIDDLANAGRSLIIGEFGSLPPQNGGSDWAGIVSYAKSKGYTVLGWAWNGDGAYGMNMAQPSWSDQPTATTFTKSSYFNTIYNLL
ncbi:hypothetical protein niasHT_027137 [Heterodera trifolii]|uniref:Glycoside hydrolase n=1 Tax=Heterodera trifolii TaxID=157864 RepID=A0ABD2KC30_9BILA